MKNAMIGVILAAGMAKRLRPLTDTKPKCLLKVGERTLLGIPSVPCNRLASQSSWWSPAIALTR